MTTQLGAAHIVDGQELRINVFDGSYKTGIRITKLAVASGDQSHQDFCLRVSTEGGITSSIDEYIDYGDSRQIAWAFVNGTTDLNVTDHYSLVDRENLVIEDLYLTVRTASSSITNLNYYMECDIYELEPFQGSLAMVQNRSQG
jgi:hypothetical protein